MLSLREYMILEAYNYDYDYILDMITFIEIGSATNNPELIQNYYLNK